MKSNSSAKSAPRVTSARARPAAAAGALESARQQAVVSNEAACAVFRGFEALRKIQEQAAHDALQRHGTAVGKLLGSASPAELATVQTALLRADLEPAVRYWQELTAASLEMQSELMNCSTQLVDSDTVMEEWAAVKSLPGVIPGLQVFVDAMNLPMMNLAGKSHRPREEAS